MQNRVSIMHNLLLIGHLSTYIQVAVKLMLFGQEQVSMCTCSSYIDQPTS